MDRRISDRQEQKLMEDDPLQCIMWLTGSKLKNHIYVMRAIIIIVVSYLQMFNLICIKDIILNRNFTYLEYLPLVFIQQPGCFGLIIVFVYVKDFFQYQEIAFNNFWSISSRGKNTKDRILRESKIINLTCVFNSGLLVLAHLSSVPIVGDEQRLIFAIMYCTEHFGRWSKVFIFIFYVCLLFISYGVACPLFGAVYVTFHAKFQFYLLNVDIRRISKEDLVEKHFNGELKRYDTISAWAKHHASVKMVTKTFLGRTQNITMLMFFVCTILAFVATCCFLIFELSPSSNWRGILVLSSIMSLCLLVAVSGQKITDESNQVFLTLCNTPRYHWTKRSQMAVGMMLMNSMEPLVPTCFGLFDLNYQFLVLGARVIYSLLALSRKFKHSGEIS